MATILKEWKTYILEHNENRLYKSHVLANVLEKAEELERTIGGKRQLSFEERKKIEILCDKGMSIMQISNILERDRTFIGKEIARFARPSDYKAELAHKSWFTAKYAEWIEINRLTEGDDPLKLVNEISFKLESLKKLLIDQIPTEKYLSKNQIKEKLKNKEHQDIKEKIKEKITEKTETEQV